ncbi:MAG TPA: alpha/beta hydrolase [Anaerolineaceae bacterium]|nr:alpha/beta hydrolase [Anaerolineaceae bacterium]
MLPARVEKYDIHPDFALKVTPYSTPATVRLAASLVAIANRIIPLPDGYLSRKTWLKSLDGTHFPVEIVWPENIDRPAACLVYYHGGGFVLGNNPLQERLFLRIAENVPFVLVMPGYRLAPDHPFPAGVEDCYATLLWVARYASRIGIDRSRIAVAGDSAGGGLAAAVTQMARDKKGPAICLQILLYPVTDCSMTTESANLFTDTPVWNSVANRKMWEFYLNGWEGPASPYASPMHAGSLAGLPPAYVETAEFDPLHDEGIEYARRMVAEGVEVTLHETKRTVHGYDIIKMNEIVEESLALRTQAIKKAFHQSAAESLFDTLDALSGSIS